MDAAETGLDDEIILARILRLVCPQNQPRTVASPAPAIFRYSDDSLMLLPHLPWTALPGFEAADWFDIDFPAALPGAPGADDGAR